MSRRPVPCRECGKPCQVGKGSRPEPTCLECRRTRPGYRDRYRVPCAGCGKEVQRNGTSAIPTCLDCRRSRPGYKGKRVSAPPRQVTCVVCGTTVQTKQPSQKTCLSDECRRKIGTQRRRRYLATDRGLEMAARAGSNSCKIWVRDCEECGRLFVGRAANQIRCSDECRRKWNSRVTSEAVMRRYHSDPEFRDLVISRAHNRQARKLGIGTITSPASLVAYLMDRDKRQCQLPDCQHTTRRIQAKTGPWRPSIDHIVPLSRGGKHELANLQLTHYRCNLAKHNGGGGEQLLLVG